MLHKWQIKKYDQVFNGSEWEIEKKSTLMDEFEFPVDGEGIENFAKDYLNIQERVGSINPDIILLQNSPELLEFEVLPLEGISSIYVFEKVEVENVLIIRREAQS